jgi:hypothetical protein
LGYNVVQPVEIQPPLAWKVQMMKLFNMQGRKTNCSELNIDQYFPISIWPQICMNAILFVTAAPKNSKFVAFSNNLLGPTYI